MALTDGRQPPANARSPPGVVDTGLGSLDSGKWNGTAAPARTGDLLIHN